MYAEKHADHCPWELTLLVALEKQAVWPVPSLLSVGPGLRGVSLRSLDSRARILSLTPFLLSGVTLERLGNISVTQFPHFHNKDFALAS